MNICGKHLLPAWLIGTIAMVLVMCCIQCTESGPQSDDGSTFARRVKIDDTLPWSERMARSIMQRNPESWMTDFQESPRWDYTNGLIMTAFLDLWETTGRKEYYRYARSYADTMIDASGHIHDYSVDEYNIDLINPGRMLFPLYAETKDPRYEQAMQTLRRQLEWQPRTREGGFWHKLRYPWQMWLDGLYMAEPFYAQYAVQYGQPEALEDVLLQFRLIQAHTRDSMSGLLYHGWDESRVQQWADPVTGCSPHFWARAMGWYGMALVDVIDALPTGHPGCTELGGYLRQWADALIAVQDAETGVWYQILDSPDRPGNYLEATASCMFVYAIAKGVNLGVLDPGDMRVAQRAFDGIISEFIEVEDSGEVHLHKCCSVAGLGGSPYRDGSFEYYVSEKVRSNDPKGTGPFIMAVIELEHYEKSIRR